MNRYRVAQVGCGGRGVVHLDSWLKNPDRFEIVAVCDIDAEKMQQAVSGLGISPAQYTDAGKMLSEAKPDVFCFSTQPNVRLEMVELAAKYAVKGMVFEKPMATSLADARQITSLCKQHNIKTAVSHQHIYLTSFQKLKEIVESGAVGTISRIDATCQAGLAQLGTHYVYYILWANGGRHAKWVVGHVHGKKMLEDSHPSPDYVMGQFASDNGVRSFVEFGRLSDSHMTPDKYWVDNRLTVHGDKGYAWCDTDGRWGACNSATGGEVQFEADDLWEVQANTRLQPLFARDLADWLDDDTKVHPCNIDITYHGYEIMEALCLSALDNRRVDMPLDPSVCDDILTRLNAELPECPELVVKND